MDQLLSAVSALLSKWKNTTAVHAEMEAVAKAFETAKNETKK